MKGRKPKPTHLKLLEGNPGKRRINRADLLTPGDLDEPPSWLTQRQKDGWAYAIRYAQPGSLKLIDQSLLTIFVVASDLHRQAVEDTHSPLVLALSPAKRQHLEGILMAIANKQALIMIKVAAELGFTPTSRARIPTPAAPKPDPSGPFAKFRQTY